MMKQQEVLRKINNILKELGDQVQYLQAEEDNLNSLELELFVANAHFLTDHAEILRKICNTAQPIKELAAPLAIESLPDEQEQPVVIMAKPESTAFGDTIPMPIDLPKEPLPVDASAADVAEPEETLHEIRESAIEAPPAIVPVAERTTQTEIARSPQTSATTEVVPLIDLEGQKDTYSYIRQAPEPVTEHSFNISSDRTTEDQLVPVADTSVLNAIQQVAPPNPIATSVAAKKAVEQEDQVLTLNQRLSAQLHGGLTATAAQQKPIGDLKNAVSLNDKLMFVRDLFNGYNLAYNEAIELLNRCKTFDEADQLVKSNYVTKNNWAAKQATTDKFYSLLQRKFTK